MSNRIRAILYVLVACAFTTSTIALSETINTSISIATILFFQYFIGMLLVLPLMLQAGL